MKRQACPRCGQDWVVPAKLKGTDIHIMLCPECEAYWFVGEEVSQATYKTLDALLEKQGLPWLWESLEFPVE